MDKENLRIVFFGTPQFAVESLDTLIRNGFNVVAAVTMPDKTGGRGHKVITSAVKDYAIEHNIPLLQPEKLKSPDFIETLKALEADLFIVIAFRMLPEAVWAMPPAKNPPPHPKYSKKIAESVGPSVQILCTTTYADWLPTPEHGRNLTYAEM